MFSIIVAVLFAISLLFTCTRKFLFHRGITSMLGKAGWKALDIGIRH